jgi:catechol 2,3-dioxygenase-like lactoylglutathione lyase family enzyme
MKLTKLDHYNIETVKPEETVRFYTEALGLENAPQRRPQVERPGTWLLVGNYPAIHVNFVEADQAGKTGAIDHVAFEGAGYHEYCRHLRAFGAPFETVESPGFDLAQIYVVDPNGIRIEINFRGKDIGRRAGDTDGNG